MHSGHAGKELGLQTRWEEGGGRRHVGVGAGGERRRLRRFQRLAPQASSRALSTAHASLPRASGGVAAPWRLPPTKPHLAASPIAPQRRLCIPAVGGAARADTERRTAGRYRQSPTASSASATLQFAQKTGWPVGTTCTHRSDLKQGSAPLQRPSCCTARARPPCSGHLHAALEAPPHPRLPWTPPGWAPAPCRCWAWRCCC